MDIGDAFRSPACYEAIYLGGYSVECGLKALILSHIRKASHRTAIDQILVRLGHNLEGCRDYLNEKHQVRMPLQILLVFSSVVVPNWEVSMRYRPGQRSRDEAKSFLDATESVLRWIEGRRR